MNLLPARLRWIAVLPALLPSLPALAGEPLEAYIARLSAADHYNSSGERLRSAAAIIRQDRANLHRYGVRDPEDETDRFFAAADNRARLERLLADGFLDRTTERIIVEDTPLVRVEVWPNHVEVRLK
ncbi:hypothetical protein [Plasticicumulans sp.]|uniref:hypothetical protein n=1 Tax=Plasticicumulans sp. TaxID=2307179 RepID=UPI0039437415|nr:hypothetical protein [Pseudomonadota bacterium]